MYSCRITELIYFKKQGKAIHFFALFTKPKGNSLSPSITPENKQLMSNISAWMRCKADLVHEWVTSERCEASQCEEVEAWMPTGPSFKDESQLSNQLKCLAALWLPSPTRQRAELKANPKCRHK